MEKKVIYLAGPLFSKAERKFNENLGKKLEALGFNVLLPQVRCARLDRDNEMDRDEKNEAIFKICRDDALASDIFIYILDGRVPDEGAAVEVGIAYAQKVIFEIKPEKVIIGFKTDWRITLTISDVNQMIDKCLDETFTREKDLLKYLEKLS
ncbi:MAG: nucleoside 2-deoxyribosyltransferase [Candidatus Falkowbacteria bacterium]